MKKTAVVLFNLGGPDRLESVQPFLFNLFNDPAIISAPSILRWIIARLISKKRAPIARRIYKQLGGGSPLVRLTQQQADALVDALNTQGQGADCDYRVFMAMRYWHPMSLEAAEAVREYAPDDIILLPLYPQYSMTTTGSSIAEWEKAAAMAGITAPSRAICCYPTNEGWIDAQAALIDEGLREAPGGVEPRILFSAHGLPKKIIAKGDPYQWQVEKTVEGVEAALRAMDTPAFSSMTCYQSRVGPLEWIGPSTEEALKQAGEDGVPVVVVPIAFVSEHSETLVELDIEYRELATKWGVPHYHRVPAVGTHARFIDGLAALVRRALDNSQQKPQGDHVIICDNGVMVCPADRTQCPHKAALRNPRHA